MEWKNFSKRHNINYGKSWLLTYSDMITIILCFFIVFFTFSAKEMTIMESVRDNLSHKVDDLSKENEKLKEEQESLTDLVFGNSKSGNTDDFLQFLKDNELEESVYISEGDRGLLIRFKEGVLFPSGDASVTNDGFLVLREIGNKIKDIDNSIIIEGYTDNIPIKNELYPSNWELSVDRAIHVAKYFIDNMGINKERISVSGFGEQNPIDSNETQEGRLNNRRIEIIILN